MTRVLVVEDDPALARALGVSLRVHGYDVHAVATGTAALDLLAGDPPDLVLLDLGLPDVDGLDVLRALRVWSSTPVVVLSARQTSDDKVEALDAGADDYVTKPFAMDELMARLRAAARRAVPQAGRPQVRTAAFTVDLAARRVQRPDGTDVQVTPTEWHLLEILARNVGRVVDRADLLRELRGPYLDTESHYLRVYVAQLRRKLEPDPAHPRHLLTEPARGYRLQP